MQERITQSDQSKFVFTPDGEEKHDLISNEYLKNMPRDENLRYELIGGEIIVSTAPEIEFRLLILAIREISRSFHLKSV